MDLRELKDDIEQLKQKEEDIGQIIKDAQLKGIIQVVMIMNEFFKVPENAKNYFGESNYNLWKDIVNSLSTSNEGS